MGERTGRPRFGGGLNFRKRQQVQAGSPVTYYANSTGRLVQTTIQAGHPSNGGSIRFRTNDRVWLRFATENLAWTRGHVTEESEVGKALLAAAALVRT